MSRVPQVVVNPNDPQSMVEHLYRVQRVVDRFVEFGSPQDPTDPASTARALGTAHNGTLQNMDGSWFEAVLEATGVTTINCVHNLNVATNQPATAPNVRWLPFGVMHNGTGAAAATVAVDVWYLGSLVPTADAINLMFNLVVGGALTVNAANPVVVTLFFVRAVR